MRRSVSWSGSTAGSTRTVVRPRSKLVSIVRSPRSRAARIWRAWTNERSGAARSALDRDRSEDALDEGRGRLWCELAEAPDERVDRLLRRLEAGEVTGERAVLDLDQQHLAGVFDRRLDLLEVLDDRGVGHQTVDD